MMCPGCGVGPFDGRAYCSNCGNPTEPNAIACVKCGIAAHYAGNSQKNFVTALLLSILLGSLGVDRFYLGYVLLGILKLFTFGGFGIWWLIDVILIATNSLKDANGVPMKR
ncbi:MAG: TM2 domain-containing protein [Verrucomicrobia bacterium]|nr:TM2 domain-containing protein [Verrucomicrobiota bacterium]MBU4248096.1 TM2 domain-containing protein [Verrucomicrobiota bacterium]MBU4290772.1 TM2 domain-containing protein [Verrucomicrobiota bacterium]MBU4429753.1 TM2 domain-containing protein [Verrucomicrobiota bacterium]MBU4497444.1 TM2 domain-containing protein [Verrucomicrobiota bacterium]